MPLTLCERDFLITSICSNSSMQFSGQTGGSADHLVATDQMAMPGLMVSAFRRPSCHAVTSPLHIRSGLCRFLVVAFELTSISVPWICILFKCLHSLFIRS